MPRTCRESVVNELAPVWVRAFALRWGMDIFGPNRRSRGIRRMPLEVFKKWQNAYIVCADWSISRERENCETWSVNFWSATASWIDRSIVLNFCCICEYNDWSILNLSKCQTEALRIVPRGMAAWWAPTRRQGDGKRMTCVWLRIYFYENERPHFLNISLFPNLLETCQKLGRDGGRHSQLWGNGEWLHTPLCESGKILHPKSKRYPFGFVEQRVHKRATTLFENHK